MSKPIIVRPILKGESEERRLRAELGEAQSALASARGDLAGSSARIRELDDRVAALERERADLVAGLERIAAWPGAHSAEAKAMRSVAVRLLTDARRRLTRPAGR